MNRKKVATAALVVATATVGVVAAQQGSSTPSAVRQTKACGTERWPVKTGTDSTASQVNLTPRKTTVAALDAMPLPASLPQDTRAPAETATYSVQVTITDYKAEADSDYHLAVTQGGRTLIAEIPAPSCVRGSRFSAQIGRVRAAFDKRFHATPSYQTTSTTATITGVAFFDKIHGQRGVAPQGIELHPVLSITFP